MYGQDFQFRVMNLGRSLRILLTAAGLVLLGFGLLVLLIPQLLQLLVGGLFILAGVTLLGVAWRRRRLPPSSRQTYESDIVDEWR